MASLAFEKAVAKAAGKSIEELRDTPVDEFRRDTERRRGKPLGFFSKFPLIGRGNVLRDRCKSNKEVEEICDIAIDRLA